MRTRINKSKEEKQALVRDFLTSGKSKTVWCKEMNISLSSFSAWFRIYKNEKESVSFISLKPRKNTSKSMIPSSITTPVASAPLLLEIGSYKIQITEQISMSFLEEILKVVKSSDVSL